MGAHRGRPSRGRRLYRTADDHYAVVGAATAVPPPSRLRVLLSAAFAGLHVAAERGRGGGEKGAVLGVTVGRGEGSAGGGGGGSGSDSSGDDGGSYPPPSVGLLSGGRPRVMVALAGLLFLFLEARHYALVPSVVAQLTSGQVAAVGGVASGHAFRLAAPAELSTWVHGGGRAAAVPSVPVGGGVARGGREGGTEATAAPAAVDGADGVAGGDGVAALAPGPLEADEKVNAAAERVRDAHLFRNAAEVSSRAAALAAARAQAQAAVAAEHAPEAATARDTPVRATRTDTATQGPEAAAAAAAAMPSGSAAGSPLPQPPGEEARPEAGGLPSVPAPAVTTPPGAGAGTVEVAVRPPPRAGAAPPAVASAVVAGSSEATVAAPLLPSSTAVDPRGTTAGDLAATPMVATRPADGEAADVASRITPSPQMVEARAAIEEMGGWVAPAAELSPPRAMLDAEAASTGDLMAANALAAAQAETDNRDLEADAEPIVHNPHPGARRGGSGDGGSTGVGGDGTPIRVTTYTTEHGDVTAATADAGDEDDDANARAVAHGGHLFRGVPANAIDVAAHGGIYETGYHNLTRVSHMLYRIIRHHNVSSMLDVPCTAHVAWMPALLARLDYEIPSFRYQCMDSAPDVSAASRALRSASESATVTSGVRYWEVPLPTVDLIFSWSGLEHLTLSRTFNFFYNVRSSGSALALVGHHAGLENAVIRLSANGKRKTMTRPRPPGVNLREQPFAFVAAERVIGGFGLPPPPGGGDDGRRLRASQKQLLLYRVSKMRQSW